MSLLKNIGLHIKMYREKQNLSYSALEKISGIPKKFLKKIEKGQASKVRISHIDCLCNIFGISIFELLSEVED
ncbi:MAG: helix-turn-helix transcriptional regulator [Candidatus Gastranaerophilales bacterium]|nr:helix-turn-helix transcriptional regulator [Candidatus Gastranaerophilales bacterium]